MSTPPGDRPPAAGSTVNEDQVSSARANLGTAIAAFETIGGFARAEARPRDTLRPSALRGPARDHARLARTLCALRHLADQFGGLSFGDVLSAADAQYRLLGAGYSRPAAAPRVAMADEAIGICERNITAPRQYRGGFWPPDTLSYLRGYASRHGLGFEPAVASLTTRLIADLRHYADHQGTDFQQALAAGLRAHARQRLNEEGPFETGQDPGRRPAPESPLSATGSFHPAATNQGVVISPTDAEWLLIRTAARNGDASSTRSPPVGVTLTTSASLPARSPKPAASPPARSSAGSHPRSLPGSRRSSMAPLRLPNSDASTGAPQPRRTATDANHQYRVSLVIAYADTYQQAAEHGPPPAASPARIAARDFPQRNPPTAHGTLGAPGPGRQARATPQARPRHGPRPGA